jgi:hypothetical protein
MSPPVTDQLEERRKQRQARAAAHAKRPQIPDAARDLLTGLITGSDTEPPAPGEDAPHADANAETANTRGGHDTRSGGAENVQDLVRRVQQSTAAAAREAASAAPRRAPSTVDLPPAAAMRRLTRRAPKHETLSVERHAHRWILATAAAAAVLLLVALNGLGGRTAPTRAGISASTAALTTERTNPLADAFSATIASLVPKLRTLAGAVRSPRRRSQLRQQRTRRKVKLHVRAATQEHPTAASDQRTTTQQSPASTGPAPPSRTDTAPSTTTRHTSTATQTPASNSQPAGPTGSGPLGGLGSCVSGCT